MGGIVGADVTNLTDTSLVALKDRDCNMEGNNLKTEEDSDDSSSSSSDLLPGSKRMSSASQNDQDKTSMAIRASSGDQSVVESSSPPPSSADKKNQTLKLPALTRGSQTSTTSCTEADTASSSTTTSIKLPAGCLDQNDDCDEAEKLARKRRCEEIMRLSAKITAEAKAKASIRPLTFQPPTFPFPGSSTASASTASQEAVLGKRKVREEEQINRPSTNTFFPGPRQPTPQEVADFVSFCDKWLPSGKRRRTDSDSDK